jgi:hypothetical protein
MIDYFFETNYKSTIAQDLLDFALDKETDYSRGSVSQGFLVAKVPDYIILKDQFLSDLIRIKISNNARIFKMLPYTCYNWHTDTNRGCAINMILSGFDSHCYFGKYQSSSLLEYRELVYKPNVYYLFNTEQLHTVINGSQDRYILSIGYHKPNKFNDILNTINSLTL